VKVTGQKKLMRQMKDLPKKTHKALEKSIGNTANFGARKARSIVPVASGDLKAGISSNVKSKSGEIFGFINFYDGDNDNGLAANSINYGWGPMEFGYNFRREVKSMVADRHRRTVQRNLNKAIKDAMNG
jgi:hypothetical protein